MMYHPGADHVEVDIAQAVEEVLSILDNRAVVRVLPHRVDTMLPEVVGFGNSPGSEMHQLAHGSTVDGVYDYVYVVASDGIAIDRNPETLNPLPQPFPVGLPLAPVLQQKRLSVTAVGEVVSVPIEKIVRRPWHVSKLLHPRV
jgi:hypothetical protein